MASTQKSNFDVTCELVLFVTNMRTELNRIREKTIDAPDTVGLLDLQSKLDAHLCSTQMQIAELMKPKLRRVK